MFLRAAEGHWINNVTYCGGKHDKCTTDIIVTIANVSMPAPGVVNHKYTDAPLDPQVIIMIREVILDIIHSCN